MATVAPPRATTVAASDRAQISRVPYLPGLDGLRALAVVAVMIYHANSAWLPGRLPRRGDVLRHLRLPDHAAADRRTRAQLPDLARTLLAASGPAPPARRVPDDADGHDLDGDRSNATRSASSAATCSPDRSTCRTGTRSGRGSATPRPATSPRCATCGASRWRSSSTCLADHHGPAARACRHTAGGRREPLAVASPRSRSPS